MTFFGTKRHLWLSILMAVYTFRWIYRTTCCIIYQDHFSIHVSFNFHLLHLHLDFLLFPLFSVIISGLFLRSKFVAGSFRSVIISTMSSAFLKFFRSYLFRKSWNLSNVTRWYSLLLRRSSTEFSFGVYPFEYIFSTSSLLLCFHVCFFLFCFLYGYSRFPFSW